MLKMFIPCLYAKWYNKIIYTKYGETIDKRSYEIRLDFAQ